MGHDGGLCRDFGLLHAGRLQVERRGPVQVQPAARRQRIEQRDAAVGGGVERHGPGRCLVGAGEANTVLRRIGEGGVLRGAFGGR